MQFYNVSLYVVGYIIWKIFVSFFLFANGSGVEQRGQPHIKTSESNNCDWFSFMNHQSGINDFLHSNNFIQNAATCCYFDCSLLCILITPIKNQMRLYTWKWQAFLWRRKPTLNPPVIYQWFIVAFDTTTVRMA